MKIKSHSGAKKRVKIRANKMFMQKACKKHLLSNKSKRQKETDKYGMAISPTNLPKLRKLLSSSNI